MSKQITLFEGQRLQMSQSIQLTIDSLNTYGPLHKHWAVAWSGGKDSTALVTLVLYLIESGKVPRPQSLTVLYADTRQEVVPLAAVAQGLMEELRERGVEVRTVVAPLDLRFLVNMLGRGVPPPNNATNRWCTRQIKVDPMQAELRRLYEQHHEKFLVLTGLRIGESAARDARISLACSKDDGECGQGWYHKTLPDSLCDRLSALLHWRVCHVWEWLKHWAPQAEFGDWDTRALAEVYGGEEAEENNARFGCMGCPLVQEDKALKRAVAMHGWDHLAPLLGLQPLYEELRSPHFRLRRVGGDRRKDGVLVKGQQRLGPLTLEARLHGLERILKIQAEVNEAAARLGRPGVDLLNAEEEARIRELIALGTWPKDWEGTEPLGTTLLEKWNEDGTVQTLLPLFNS